jgi:ubiquitin C-terminal hydrolase
MLGQEMRQMTADGRIGRIGQAKAAQRALAPGGHIADLRTGKKPSTTDCRTCSRVSVTLCVAASRLLPPPAR